MASQDNVTKLRGDDDLAYGGPDRRKPASPAIGISVVMNFPGDRQATMQTFFPQEATDAEANGLLDRLFRLQDRQRARYELIKLRDDLALHQKSLDRYETDLAEVEARFAKDQAAREVEAQTLRMDADKVYKNAYDVWAGSGRTGDFQPKGATKANLERLSAGIEKIKAEIQKQDAEKKLALDNLAGTAARYREEIARLQHEIAANEAKIEG